MATTAKIATCSYCSTRVVMSLTQGARHDLICSSCGAPLTETKLIQQSAALPAMPQTLFKPQEKTKEKPAQESERKPRKKRKSRDSEDYYKRRKYEKYKDRDDDDDDDDDDEKNYKRKKSKRKRRGLLYWFREAADEIEDIFD